MARRVVKEGVRAAPGTFVYVETSALLAALLEHDAGAIRALGSPGQRITSALTGAEAYRAVARDSASGRLKLEQVRALNQALRSFLQGCDVVAVTDEVLLRAGRPFPIEPVRTLDAIHLATAELLGEPPALVTIVTRDARVRANAEAMGYMVG